MVRRPHSRVFPRPVKAPRCVAATSTPAATTPIVACSQTKHERPQSFRKGVVDVFVPSETRVSKKKQKQRQRRQKHLAALRRSLIDPLKDPQCDYGTFTDDNKEDCVSRRPHIRPVVTDTHANEDSLSRTKDNEAVQEVSLVVPTLALPPASNATLTELSLDDDVDDDESYDILSVDETFAAQTDDSSACTIC